jgi:hypothetical protein
MRRVCAVPMILVRRQLRRSQPVVIPPSDASLLVRFPRPTNNNGSDEGWEKARHVDPFRCDDRPNRHHMLCLHSEMIETLRRPNTQIASKKELKSNERSKWLAENVHAIYDAGDQYIWPFETFLRNISTELKSTGHHVRVAHVICMCSVI